MMLTETRDAGTGGLGDVQTLAACDVANIAYHGDLWWIYLRDGSNVQSDFVVIERDVVKYMPYQDVVME